MNDLKFIFTEEKSVLDTAKSICETTKEAVMNNPNIDTVQIKNNIDSKDSKLLSKELLDKIKDISPYIRNICEIVTSFY